MRMSQNIVFSVFAVAVSAAFVGNAQAEDGIQTIKPLQALSFQAGSKSAVGYYVDGRDNCRLIVTLAEGAGSDDNGFVATRYETTVGLGQRGDLRLPEGKSLEYTCQAQSMTIKSLNQVAGAVE